MTTTLTITVENIKVAPDKIGSEHPGSCVDVALKLIGGGITLDKYESEFRKIYREPLPGGSTPRRLLTHLMRIGKVVPCAEGVSRREMIFREVG